MTNIENTASFSGFSASRNVGGIRFVATDPLSAALTVCRMAMNARRTGTHVHLANAYTVALADKSSEYKAVLCDGIVLPDGKPVSWVSHILSGPAVKQVRGPSLFEDVINHGRPHQVRHFLLGSTPEVLADLESRLEAKFPGVEIVGSASPPFRQMAQSEYDEQDQLIRDSGADIVWVGLGTPKQDFEAQRVARSVPVIAVAVGAAFDFSAGNIQPAPKWMQSVGLEWVFRLISEPRRLWKRYLFGNFRFILAVLRSR